MIKNTRTQRTADRLRHMIVEEQVFHYGEKLQNENELSISISNNSKLLSCAIFGSAHTIGFESNLSEF